MYTIYIYTRNVPAACIIIPFTVNFKEFVLLFDMVEGVPSTFFKSCMNFNLHFYTLRKKMQGTAMQLISIQSSLVNNDFSCLHVKIRNEMLHVGKQANATNY
jgi:hypothetical protein